MNVLFGMHLISMVYQIFVYRVQKFGCQILFYIIQPMIILKVIIRVKRWCKTMDMFFGRHQPNFDHHAKLMSHFFLLTVGFLVIKKTSFILFYY